MMLFIAVYYRNACAIPDNNTVVITGGHNTRTSVSRYNDQGWIEDLPSLITGRYGHACAGYTSEGNRVRYTEMRTAMLKLNSVQDVPC